LSLSSILKAGKNKVLKGMRPAPLKTNKEKEQLMNF
jgi:hypothetical protein